MLVDHESDGDKSTLSVGWNKPHFALEIPEAGTSNEFTLSLQLTSHIVQLHSDVWVISWEVANSDQDSASSLPVICFGKETSRLCAEPDTDEKDDSWKTLEGQGNEVDGLSFAVLVGSLDGVSISDSKILVRR